MAPPKKRPIAVGVIGPADPTRAPNNPFYIQAQQLAAQGDKAGLRQLDRQLAQAGYAATGQTRTLIAQALATKEG